MHIPNLIFLILLWTRQYCLLFSPTSPTLPQNNSGYNIWKYINSSFNYKWIILENLFILWQLSHDDPISGLLSSVLFLGTSIWLSLVHLSNCHLHSDLIQYPTTVALPEMSELVTDLIEHIFRLLGREEPACTSHASISQPSVTCLSAADQSAPL